MNFQPDVVVLAPDLPRVELLVEVKLRPGAALPLAEQQLKHYMRARGCAAGLLVSLDETRFYEDRYLGRSEDSIEHVGTLPTAVLLPLAAPVTTEQELQGAVRAWLERLVSAQPAALPTPPEARGLVEKYLLPAVAGGRVSADGLE